MSEQTDVESLKHISSKISFPDTELEILKLWDRLDAFKTCQKRSKEAGLPEFTFYDGPPFATGTPHYGHILAGTMKDSVTRYAYQTGHHVERKFGWDCHGLPIEFEIDKLLGIKTREQVLEYGVANYNEACRGIVMKYSSEWERVVNRVGRWIDMKNDYKTMDLPFMESVWHVFSRLFEEGLVYQGYKVMPFSTGCHTPLSNFEAGQDYQMVTDPAVYVTFPLVEEPEVSLVAWTTTPWTLPSNLALNVNPKLKYAKIKVAATGNVHIMLESRAKVVFPKSKKAKEAPFEVLETFLGSTLAGKEYAPVFPYFAEWQKKGAFRVLLADYVTDDSGTGVVHCAPAFGEEDFQAGIKAGFVSRADMPCPVDDNGCFTEEVTDYVGVYVKDADKDIIIRLKTSGRIIKSETIKHSYPFCWRSHTPLIYRAVASWFVSVEVLREKLLKSNAATYWVPTHVKEKRFTNWLAGATDWCISRNRFWGTPIPLWVSEDGTQKVAINSVAELEKHAQRSVTDLHLHKIDDIVVADPRGGDYPPMKRIPEVFDCWFESGSMPYGQHHYPFENKESFEANFPADFIAEGLDQTRGWFYTLTVISTVLFGKAPFKNVMVNGMVLAEDGSKMSKSKKNYPEVDLVMNKYGADSLRLYLINSPVVRGEPLKFSEEGVKGVIKDTLLPWFNAFRFFVENALKYQHDTGKPFVVNPQDATKSTNLMDRWILSSTQSLISYVRKEMAGYHLSNVVPHLLTFVEQLTNWYVRFNRTRAKGKFGEQDSYDCLSTLFRVLYAQTVLMAPFVPFFSEYVFQSLRLCLPEEQREDSVHYMMIPEANASLSDPALEAVVAQLQSVVDLARAARDRRTLPIKTPLRAVHVVHASQEELDSMTPFLGYVKAELNVRDVVQTAQMTEFVGLSAKLDRKLAGKRFKRESSKMATAVEKLTHDELTAAVAQGSVTVEGHELQMGSEVQVVRQFRGDKALFEANWDDKALVVLEITVDAELQLESYARAASSQVQRYRKELGVLPTDDISVFYRVTVEGDLGVSGALATHEQFISKKLDKPFALAPAIFEAALTLVGQKEVVVEDCELTLFVMKK